MNINAKVATGFGLVLAVMIASPSVAGVRSAAHFWSDSQRVEYRVIQVVNRDQFEGEWKQFKGELKKRWSKFTDDDLRQIEGNFEKFMGKIQERYGDQKEEVKRWTEEWFKKDGQNKSRS